MTLEDIANASGPASELVLRDEVGDDSEAAERIKATMLSRLGEMRDAIRRGLATRAPSRTGIALPGPAPAAPLVRRASSPRRLLAPAGPVPVSFPLPALLHGRCPRRCL